MIRIAISPEAFEAICNTLPPGGATFEPQIGAKGERYI
jgi:hypothetical protein